MDTKAMYKLTYGLFVLTTESEGRINGCITNTAIQVANDPTRIGLAVNKANFTEGLIQASRKFNISIIAEDADFALFKHFGFQSGRDVDKFADFTDCRMMENGVPIITKGTNAYMTCTVTETHDLGSHTFFVATIEDMGVLADTDSCSYTYYQNNIKPKPEKPAEAKSGKVVWRCTVCGYEYEGDPIPEDFICPLCKHPASDFERVEL